MRKLACSFASVVALTLSTVAYAEVKTDAAAKVQYEIPAGFKATVQDNMTMLEEPKKEIMFLIVRSDAADPQKAMADTTKVVDQIVTDVKQVGEPAKIKQNGMDAVQMRATGSHEGKPTNVMLLIVKSPAGKTVIFVGAVEAAKKEAWGKTFMGFVNSIKPAS